ncbi:MAG: hypothetical protein AAFZ89_08620 [Bacteroidota bacterium]
MEKTSLAFKKEIIAYYPDLSESEWEIFRAQLKPKMYKKGTTIFSQATVCKHVLFVSEGIVASEYQTTEDQVINRFFNAKALCSNVESLMSGTLNNDRMFAITNVLGVLIPKSTFIQYYLHSDRIGLYFRMKLLDIIREDKQFISMKTNSRIETQLTFLQENYPDIILETPWKYIASFIGVTPAWLSRKLKENPKMKK